MSQTDSNPEDPDRSTLSERLLDLMFERIELLNSIGIALSAETNPVRLQEKILIGAKELTLADGGTIYSFDTERQELRFEIMRTDSLEIALGGSSDKHIDLPPVKLYRDDGTPNRSSVVAYSVLEGRTINIPDAYDAPGFDFSGTRLFDERNGYRSKSMLTVPMRNHEDEIIGVLQLLNAHPPEGEGVIPFSNLGVRLAESLASQAAIALTRHKLVKDLEALFEGFVKLIADAIDAKSPYTGGHCRRVPEITMLLAEAVAGCEKGPLAEFEMSDQDRYELNIAALLHDCGKITTPEWVMDKATKLQTVFDRIKLVDTRFEVLKRDAELELLRAQRDGADPAAAERKYRNTLAQIEDDKAFLHHANLGREFMAEDDQERVREIAGRRWVGPDGDERAFLSDEEVENLCIARGTLTGTERQIIQNHIVATINMLESLPYPKHLRRVPEFAGGHHERIDGKGYPRGLTGGEMSVQARMMAIADVFEALTAADRPYKKAMKLSQALEILGRMKLEGHIDPDLFA